MYEFTGVNRYLDAALLANAFVRKTIRMDGSPDEVGGVQGSYPSWGDYCTYQYVNWAAKFTLDANMLEERLLTARAPKAPSP